MKILSLNISDPAPMEWNGQSVHSSMVKRSVPEIIVHEDRVEGNSFGLPKIHGNADAVLYAFGLQQAEVYARALGLTGYPAGLTGETLTLDSIEEEEVSVGDIFTFGSVTAQAVYPRIPCNRLNYRLQNPNAQAAMQKCGHSGVYFRILRPGRIRVGDPVAIAERALHRFSIARLYRKLVQNEAVSAEEKQLALANGAFQQKILERWARDLSKESGE